jgi:spore coat protein A
MPAMVLANGIDVAARDRGTDSLPAYRAPHSLDRFIDPLRIPKPLMPHETRRATDLYVMRMAEFTQQMHSQLPPTRLWGYESQYPGPTIEAHRGRTIEVRWENHLPSRHIFAIDPHIHGAMPPAPEVIFMVRALPRAATAFPRSGSFRDLPRITPIRTTSLPRHCGITIMPSVLRA